MAMESVHAWPRLLQLTRRKTSPDGPGQATRSGCVCLAGTAIVLGSAIPSGTALLELAYPRSFLEGLLLEDALSAGVAAALALGLALALACFLSALLPALALLPTPSFAA